MSKHYKVRGRFVKPRLPAGPNTWQRAHQRRHTPRKRSWIVRLWQWLRG